jgi:transposase
LPLGERIPWPEITLMNKNERFFTDKSKLKDCIYCWRKQVIVGFGNWGNPYDSSTQGHHRGPVQELKNKLQELCQVVDVDEFRTSKLCCHCHCEMAKVKNNGKEINSVLCCNNNECGITMDHDISGARNIFMFLEKMIQKERQPEAFCRSKINGFRSNYKP